VNGFMIDRGVTLFGNGFASMRALVRRLELFGRSYARANLEWEFRIPPVAAVTAADGLKICCWIAEFHCARESLACGLAGTYCAIIAHSVMGTAISVQRWTVKTLRLIPAHRREELFEQVPSGLNGPRVARWKTSSRVISDASRLEPARPRTMESYRRSDRIPETAAAQVQVLTGARVFNVEQRKDGAQVEAEIQGKPRSFRTQAVIFATPGQHVPALCPGTSAGYARDALADAYIANRKRGGGTFQAAKYSYAGYAFTQDVVPGRGNRNGAPPGAEPLSRRHGDGHGILWNTPEKLRLDARDESLKHKRRRLWSKISPNATARFFSSI